MTNLTDTNTHQLDDGTTGPPLPTPSGTIRAGSARLGRLRRGLTVALAVLLAVGALNLAAPNPASADHRSVVTTDRTQRLTSTQLFSVAKGYSDMTRLALAACGAPGGAAATAAAANLRYAVRLTPFGRVSAGWLTAVWAGYQKISGVNFCDVAYKASQGAAWAAYYGAMGGTTSRIYILQEDRHLAPDVCRVWQSFGGYWIVLDLRTGVSPFSGGCPRA